MKALQLLGPNELVLRELPRPDPGPGEVLVRVAAVGICQTDIELLTGVHGALRAGLTQYPFTPGHEWSGYVEALGAGVSGVRVGDLVCGETGMGCGHCRLCLTGHHNICHQVQETGILARDGGMREYHVHPAAFVHRWPHDDPLAAALTEPASVGVYACHKAGVSPLDRVAVVGAGSIGQCCAQAARAFGARYVLVISRSAPKLLLAEELGADLAVSSDAKDVLAVAADVTEGDLFDVVIEAAGTRAAFDLSLRLCGHNGRVAMVGLSAPEAYGFGLDTVIDREQTIIGVRGSPNVYAETVDLLATGKMQAHPLISGCYPLEAYAEAFALAQSGQPNILKVLLTPGSPSPA